MPKELVEFLTVVLNGVTLAAVYFIVASGFTLIFGLMRTTNMAHGAFYLLGAYAGYTAVSITGSWVIGLLVGAAVVAVVGTAIYLGLLARMAGQDLRQALVTIGVSIIIADLMLAQYGGVTYQIPVPSLISGSTQLPFVVGGGYSTIRLFVVVLAVAVYAGLWLVLNRTRIGMYIRAG
ncbi:MAG: branched-chain amino acid ABC transporter permease, partial [Chloroflexi bacterium]|nr:branched-chain amino acid ABC transporter permease [Chloroflexota bacterium]